jgi:hypothetical protein
MTGFSELERHVLGELQAGNGLLKAVREKFCEMKADEYRRACAQNMAHVPRHPEVAADYAAKAQAYETFCGPARQHTAAARQGEIALRKIASGVSAAPICALRTSSPRLARPE